MSAREFKPGDVIAFTIGGTEYHGIIDVDGRPYTTDKRARGHLAAPEKIRPLVVLDLDEGERAALLRHCETSLDFNGDTFRSIREQCAPKPAEPTGLGAVVEDSEGVLWMRCCTHEDCNPWRRFLGDVSDIDVNGRRVHYPLIDVVAVLSEGVQP